jgi:hypothetical protein
MLSLMLWQGRTRMRMLLSCSRLMLMRRLLLLVLGMGGTCGGLWLVVLGVSRMAGGLSDRLLLIASHRLMRHWAGAFYEVPGKRK